MSDVNSGIPIKALQSYDNVKNDEEVFSSLKELEEYRKKRDNTRAISKNEEFDDISTNSIGYLLINFTAAELYGKLKENRLQALDLSQTYYITFLNEMSKLKFINKQHITNLINGIEETAEQARTTRIERYRESQKAKATLKFIENKRNQGREDIDDEDERDYWKALIKVSILESLDNYGYQKRELTMLKEINALKEKGQFESRKEKEDQEAEKRRKEFKTFTIPKQPTTQDLEQLQGFAAHNQRVAEANTDIVEGFAYKPEKLEIMKGVFNPRFKFGRLMTDDDFAEEEKEEMMEPVTEPDRTSADEDSDDDDEKLKEKREWDEFKDLNPRGSGNTFNMG